MRKNGFEKDLLALLPRECFHVHIINKTTYGFSHLIALATVNSAHLHYNDI